jgi:hypothetical protein
VAGRLDGGDHGAGAGIPDSDERVLIGQRDEAGKQACPPVVENPGIKERGEGGDQYSIFNKEYSMSGRGEGEYE